MHPTDHKGLVQEKMCRALPHSLVPAGVHKFNNKTTKRDFQCAICHNPKIGDPQVCSGRHAYQLSNFETSAHRRYHPERISLSLSLFVSLYGLQGQWFRRDLLCDPEIAAVCMACWRVYTNFTEKVKKVGLLSRHVNLVSNTVLSPTNVDSWILPRRRNRGMLSLHSWRRTSRISAMNTLMW